MFSFTCRTPDNFEATNLFVTCSYRAVTQRHFRHTSHWFHTTKVRIAKAVSQKELVAYAREKKTYTYKASGNGMKGFMSASASLDGNKKRWGGSS